MVVSWRLFCTSRISMIECGGFADQQPCEISLYRLSRAVREDI
jgi:hypothetical protein